MHEQVVLARFLGENQLRGNLMELRRVLKSMIGCMGAFLLMGLCAAAQTPSKALLVLEKNGTQLDVIDPMSLKTVAKVPAGQDPHEVIASGGRKAGLHFELWRGAKLAAYDLSGRSGGAEGAGPY
jgi:hypothetical protein